MRWHGLFWIAAAVLGLTQTFAHRHDMNGDGISYLDMGDAYWRADWKMAINSVFSPLYSWLTGLALRIFKPSAYWEFTVVHLVNFAIYLLTLACFTFFLRQLIKHRQERNIEWAREGFQGLSEHAWLVVGYTLFIYSSIVWITLEAVEPDMCVAAFVYLAAGILLRIRRGDKTNWIFVTLGFVLALGYFAKAVMFPVGLIFLLVAILIVGDIRKALPRVALAAIVFLVVSSPFIFAISKAKGKLTIGESGPIVYATVVNHIPNFDWQGSPRNGTPLHPSRRIFDSPPVYEFATPIKGTYPNWYDASYWSEGIKPDFNFKQQIKAFVVDLQTFHDEVVTGFMVGIAVIVLMLLYVSYAGKKRSHVWPNIECWFFLPPSIAVISMYMLLHLETRYIAPFIVLVCVTLFACVRLPESLISKKLISGVACSIVVIFALAMVPASAAEAFATVNDFVRHRDAERNLYWQVADGMNQMGLEPGDRVATVGGSITHSKWARLLRIQIIAEIYSFNIRNAPPNDDEARFWASDGSVKNQVMNAFSRAGATAVVTMAPEAAQDSAVWHQVGTSGFYVHFFH